MLSITFYMLSKYIICRYYIHMFLFLYLLYVYASNIWDIINKYIYIYTHTPNIYTRIYTRNHILNIPRPGLRGGVREKPRAASCLWAARFGLQGERVSIFVYPDLPKQSYRDSDYDFWKIPCLRGFGRFVYLGSQTAFSKFLNSCARNNHSLCKGSLFLKEWLCGNSCF